MGWSKESGARVFVPPSLFKRTVFFTKDGVVCENHENQTIAHMRMVARTSEEQAAQKIRPRLEEQAAQKIRPRLRNASAVATPIAAPPKCPACAVVLLGS